METLRTVDLPRSRARQGGDPVGNAGTQPRNVAPAGQGAALLEVSGDKADLVTLTEAELAAIRAAEGKRILHRNGVYWRSTCPGFYQRVHPLSRARASEATRPSPLCWGYRVALADEDRGEANAAIPLYLLADVNGFAQGLSRNRKGDLRKCRRLVEFRVLRDPSLLLEQGHRVFTSATEGLGFWKPMTEVEYRRCVQDSFTRGRPQVVAGLLDGCLAGYLLACAVEGILYLEHIFVCTEARRTGIGTGLYVVSIENALRSGRVHEICNSFHTPDIPSLCHFKESLGFVLADVPARLVIPAPVLALVRRRRPGTYYRLTGRLPEPSEAPST